MAGVHHTVERPFRRYAQDMAQIRFRINVVQKASADKPIQQCTALAAEEHKSFYFRDRWHKGLFPRHYVCLRLTVNTVITECAPLIQYTAEPFSQSGFLDSVAFFSTMHACSESSNSLLFFCLTTRCAGLVNDGDTCLRESNKWLATILGTKLC